MGEHWKTLENDWKLWQYWKLLEKHWKIVKNTEEYWSTENYRKAIIISWKTLKTLRNTEKSEKKNTNITDNYWGNSENHWGSTENNGKTLKKKAA